MPGTVCSVLDENRLFFGYITGFRNEKLPLSDPCPVLVQASSPSLGKQVILARMSPRFGGRETLGMDDLEVKYIFGYCLADCSGSASKTWVSGVQTSAEFQYPVPLLPPGPVTLVACASDVFKGVITVLEDCETQTVQVEHFQASDQGFVPECLPCSSDADAVSPGQALHCLLASVSTCQGIGSEDLKVDSVTALLMKAGDLLDSGMIDRGLLSAVLKAVESVISLETQSTSVIREAVAVLRLGTYRIQEAAAGDSGAIMELSSSVLNAMSGALNQFGVLSSASNDPGSTGSDTLDSTGCSIADSARDAREQVASMIFDSMTIGTEELVTSDDYRLITSVVDFNNDGNGDTTYVLSGPNDGGDGGRRRALRRSLRAVSAEAVPEVDMPRGLLDACKAYPRDQCPRPMLIEASYTRDATFLLQGLVSGSFLTAAATFAGVNETGLVVNMVSGMVGFRLASLGRHQSGADSLLNSSAALHFPLDGQVRCCHASPRPSRKRVGRSQQC